MRCPILPLTDEGFNAALAALYPDVPDEVRRTMGIYIGDVMMRARRTLGLQESGYYDLTTVQTLRAWAEDHNLLIDPLIDVAGPVTTCRIYRSLGVSCEGVYVMANVTPNQDYIAEAISQGRLRLECPAGFDVSKILIVGVLAAGGYLIYRTLRK